MTERDPYEVTRDRAAPRLAELARLLEDPTPRNIAIVRTALERLGGIGNKSRD